MAEPWKGIWGAEDCDATPLWEAFRGLECWCAHRAEDCDATPLWEAATADGGRVNALRDLVGVDGDEALWMLLLQDDGPLWGVADRSGSWRLSSSQLTAARVDVACPTPDRGKLWELRLFSASQQTLLWRHDDGDKQPQLAAATVTDDTAPSDGPTRPRDEWRPARGVARVAATADFVVLRDRGGALTALPRHIPSDDAGGWTDLGAGDDDRLRDRWPTVEVRLLWQQHPRSGAVSPAVVRWRGMRARPRKPKGN